MVYSPTPKVAARRGNAPALTLLNRSSGLARARRRTHHRTAALLAGIAAVPVLSLLAPPAASAATVYWDIDGAAAGAGGATPAGTWSGVDANWNVLPDGTGAVAPWVNNDTAVFSAGTDATGSYTVTVGGTPAATGINVEEGGTITLSGGGLDTNTGAGTTVNTATGTALTVTSIISGAERLIKNGDGTLNLGTAINQLNTMTGGVTLNGGVTVIAGENSATAGSPNALGANPGAPVANYIEINNGATLRSTRNVTALSSFVLPNRGITIGAGGAVFDVANAGAQLQLAGKITGTGGFTKIGPGQLRVDAATNDFVGDVLVKEGTLGIGTGTTTLGATTNVLRLQGGNMAYILGRTLSNPVSFEADVLFTNNSAATSGGRTMGFSSNSITTTAGTVRIRNLSTAPNPTTPPVAVLRFTGGGYDFTRPIVIGDAADVANALSRLEFLTDSPTPPQTFSGLISGPGILRRTNNVADQGGDTILTQANTYAGGTEINGGFVGVGNNLALSTGLIMLGSPGSTDDTTGFFAVGGPRTMPNNITMGTQTNIRFKGTENLTFGGTIDLGAVNRTFSSVGTGVTTFANAVSGPGINLTKAGTGTLVLSGANTYTGATIVNEGKLAFGASQNSSTSLNVAAGSSAELLSTATGTTTVKTVAIGLSGDAKIDLKTNKLIGSVALGTWTGSEYTPDTISGWVDDGRGDNSNAQWNGSGIVTSDTRAVNNNDLVSIGTAKVGDIKGIGDGATTTFGGQTVLASDSVAMVTWGGDANLDGKINIDDYGQIDFNVSSSGSVFGWYNGDFNYDGKINIDDYGIIDFNVTAQSFQFASGESSLGGVAAVPEPASLSLLALGALGLARRRARR